VALKPFLIGERTFDRMQRHITECVILIEPPPKENGGSTLFAQLFKRPSAVERYQTAPLAESRLRYLRHCAEEGAAQRTLRKIAAYQLILVDCLDLVTAKKVRSEQIDDAADRWISRQPAYHSQKDARASRVCLIAQAKHWLRFLGRLYTPTVAAPPHAQLIEEFARHMGQERGLSPLTIHTRCGRVAEFLTWSCGGNRTLQDLSILDIDAAIARKGAQGCTRASIQTYALVLRAFFRYAEMRGSCKPGLAAAIMPPRVYKGETLPAGPTWEDVRRLLASTVSKRPADIRDRAMLMLFAVYGLRVAEVRRLHLEDLDWDRETIRITRSKQQRRIQVYPLSGTVGEAILRYLKEVRPRCEYREVFMPLKAPFRPLGNGALWQVVSRRLRALNIAAQHQGPHALRHACATRMLARGASMKEIGDQLGHGTSAATSVYAKVDVATLRQVADFRLGGLK
jgi:site-specific recombinase XerD